MFASTLLRKRSAMSQDASPAVNDDAEAGEPPSANGSKSRKAARYQYATGDTPLEGYTIKRGVGRGGFGEVYFATSDAGKEVALKLIRRNLDIELRGVRQCLNLKHPNLVSLFDLRTDSADDQWVVMEFVSGESLEDAINRQPDGMPVEEALQWLRGIAAGVGYLHSSGIVHRDLKPGNIYLERGAEPISQRVRIGDYGLSKFISTSRRSGQTESVGTVHYMAPEIAGGRYGREIDTYALGVILYEMLTGHVPFEGESVGEVLMKHLTAEPELSKVDEPYQTIIARALAKDPESRLSSVEEMIALLPNRAEPVMEVVHAPAVTPTVGEVWAPVSRPPHTHHPKPQREPLWEGLVKLTDDLRTSWRGWNAPPLGKGLVLFGIVSAALVTAPAWLSVAGSLAIFYLVYYIIWAAFLQGATSAPTPTATPAAAKPKPTKPNRARYDWRAAAMRERSKRTTRQKATTLTGSMLGASVMSILVAVIASPIITNGTGADPLTFGVWFASIATLGSWAVLGSSALSERFFEDRLPRRGLNLLMGLGLGTVAAGLMGLVGQGVPFWDEVGPRWNESILEKAFDIDLYQAWSRHEGTGLVPLAGSVAYFGAMFAILRWWQTTLYTRRARVSLWSVFAAGLGAWLVSIFTWYPQPTGIALAGAIALAVQAASPWCPPSKRAALARGTNGGVV